MSSVRRRVRRAAAPVCLLLALGLALGLAALGRPAGLAAGVAGPAVLDIDAPRQVGVGEAVRLRLTVRGAADLGGYEAAVTFDPGAAEAGALFQRDNDLKQLGRAVEPLGEVPLPGGG